MKSLKGDEVRRIREKRGISLREFWKRLGVPQAVGSRYEGKSAMPRYLQMLIALAYSDKPQQSLNQLRGSSN